MYIKMVMLGLIDIHQPCHDWGNDINLSFVQNAMNWWQNKVKENQKQKRGGACFLI